jgi:hypothetical protein
MTDAARAVLAAQHLLLRRSGAASPLGTVSPGDGRWHPSAGELQSCCWLRYPPQSGQAIPKSYREHAATLDHVARMFSVDWSVLRVAVRLLATGEPVCVVGDAVAVMLVRQRLDPRGRLPEARAVRRITQAVRLARDPTRSGTATPS